MELILHYDISEKIASCLELMNYTAVGDDVNVTDSLITTCHVYDVTKDTFEFKSFGSINVKGKKKPVDVFEVI
jgi:class 3 adenylate cyclase